MLTLLPICVSMGGHEAAVTSWEHTSDLGIIPFVDDRHMGYLSKLADKIHWGDEEIIGWLHADLTIHEVGWDTRVLLEFEQHEDCAVVGFGGALRLGHPDIYRVPYSWQQLARGGFMSNLTDAEAHGTREQGSREVACVDGFALFVRRRVLDLIGGWPLGRYPDNSHCIDQWVNLMARRYGYTTRMVGVSCTHTSGGKGAAGVEWLEKHEGGDVDSHRRAHKVLYDEFRDLLPLEVK